jgi:serine protease Do
MAEALAGISSGIGATTRRFPARPVGLRDSIAAVVAAGFLAGTSILADGASPAQAQPVQTLQAQAVPRAIGFADVVEKVKPAVISVRVKIDAGKQTRETSPFPKDSPLDRFFRRFGQPDAPERGPSPRGRNFVTGQGSGFFISADGYAVTNFHVVEKASNVEVTADDGRVFRARVIGADQRSDIALIKVDDAGPLPFVGFAETVPRIGDWVLAVGNPFGLGGSVTAGIISARGRDIGAGPYDDFLQIDAAVNRGNSGGPTFDIDGNVIGVNTAIVSPSGGSVGIAFAIPAETVKAVVTQLKAAGKVTRGWIGVQIQEVTPALAEDLGLKSSHGALVAEPQAGAPAAKAGIESGDVIIAVNGKDVHDSREAARMISNLAPGTTAAIGVIHRGQEKTFDIVLGNLPDQREASVNPELPKQRGTVVPRLGVSVAPGADGVVVTNVDPDGLAAEHGFKTGDVILQVAGKKVGTAVDLRGAIDAAVKAGKPTVLMRVKSAEGIRYVAVPVGRA